MYDDWVWFCLGLGLFMNLCRGNSSPFYLPLYLYGNTVGLWVLSPAILSKISHGY